GFALLALTAAGMWALNYRLFMSRQRAVEQTQPLLTSRQTERFRAGASASIVVGSRNLANFDPALVIYTFAVVFATWGIVYHYAIWLNKPPTRRFFDRTFQLIGPLGLMRALGVITKTAAT